MRRRHLITGLVLCATAAGTALAGTAGAATESTSDPTVRTITNQKTSAELDAYWTPERIANAKPMPAPKVASGASSEQPAPAADAVGEAVTVPGTTPASEGPTTKGIPETTGRLFFSVGDTDYICTATVVASNNKSVISTARHCGFQDGGTNYRYAPSYNAGDAPHGWWDWNLARWVDGGDGITHDFAFVSLYPQDDRRVGDVVGTSGLAFNEAIEQYAYIAGIPGDPDTFTQCEGDAYSGPEGQQLMDNCEGMSGGASGGSWLINPQPEGWAYQVGTYFGSYGDAAAGSYFGDEAQGVWDQAQND